MGTWKPRAVIRGIILFVVGVPLVLMLFGVEAAFRTAFAEPKAPECPPPLPLEEVVRNVSYVFDGIVIDKWMELTPTRNGFIRTDHYRFQVTRAWQPDARREMHLSHTFVDGYRYHTFELGQRYLVFPILHDMPAQLFAWECTPYSKEEDIEAMAARLGPPAVTFDENDVIEVPVSVKLTRHAQMAMAILLQPLWPALASLDSVL